MKTKFIFLILITLVSCNRNYDYELGEAALKQESYDEAEKFFANISKDDEKYNLAQEKIKEIQSIREKQAIEAIEKRQQDSLAVILREKEKIEDLRNRINRELESLKNFNGSQYRGDISSIQLELALFGAWKLIIYEAENSSDPETLKAVKIFKSKVASLQKVEFPKLRKSYAEYAKDKLWSDNINVTIKGANYSTIEFTGSLFANNKNIQDTQSTLSEILNQLRFKRVNYKWYKYDDEYTYYTLTTSKDEDIK